MIIKSSAITIRIKGLECITTRSEAERLYGAAKDVILDASDIFIVAVTNGSETTCLYMYREDYAKMMDNLKGVL